MLRSRYTTVCLIQCFISDLVSTRSRRKSERRIREQHTPAKPKQKTTRMDLLGMTRVYRFTLHINPSRKGLSIAALLFSMVFVCEACGSSFKYNSDRGLRQHQLNCEEFLQADNEASTVDDALEKYRRKVQRKKQKAALSEVSLTVSGVCYFFILYFYTHHSL
jgi:hypothetical protein